MIHIFLKLSSPILKACDSSVYSLFMTTLLFGELFGFTPKLLSKYYEMSQRNSVKSFGLKTPPVGRRTCFYWVILIC